MGDLLASSCRAAAVMFWDEAGSKDERICRQIRLFQVVSTRLQVGSTRCG